MNTSQETAMLSKPTGADQIPLGTIWYFRARNRMRLYSLVMSEFKKSGLSQADLARRLGKKPDRICKTLAAPGNWTNDTPSDYLFAISGAEIKYELSYPLDGAPRNFTVPDWLDTTTPTVALNQPITRGQALPTTRAFSSTAASANVTTTIEDILRKTIEGGNSVATPVIVFQP